jgi:hypothetical protein
LAQYGDDFLRILKGESKETKKDETSGTSDGTDC